MHIIFNIYIHTQIFKEIKLLSGILHYTILKYSIGASRIIFHRKTR